MSDFPFEPRTTQFSKNNALCCAKASALAYENGDRVGEKLKKWGFEKFKFFDHKGTQAFIAATKELILVSFRGTEPTKLQDLASDADLRMTPGPGGKVHSGFLRALNQVMEGVHWTIREYKEEYINKLETGSGQQPPSLWFTGHSLGAGLATLAVAKMRIENEDHEEPVHGLYTYGSPRVGNKEFSEKFNANFKNQTFRIVNNNDIVTRVPIRAHGYRHIGQFWYITSEGKLENDIGFWNLELDRIKGRIEDIGKIGGDGLKDHFMEDEYIPNLTKIANSV
ncbi:MAG: lipase family protein [Nitrospina sp.]|jgi:triacylglycerol lipase|nr:lipase family protein [Nitrospina sp.]